MHEKAGVLRAVGLRGCCCRAPAALECGRRRSRWMRTRGRPCSASKMRTACLPMASTTKIMTALVALGEGDLGPRVHGEKGSTRPVEGSSMYLARRRKADACATRSTACCSPRATMRRSAVAGECGGDARRFVRQDERTRRASLGLTDTRFENPSGLPSDAPLHDRTRACEDHRRRAARPGVPRHRVDEDLHGRPAARSSNHNRLLTSVRRTRSASRPASRALPGAVWCRQLSGTAGRSYAVTLNDPDDWNDHIALLDDAFCAVIPR